MIAIGTIALSQPVLFLLFGSSVVSALPNAQQVQPQHPSPFIGQPKQTLNRLADTNVANPIAEIRDDNQAVKIAPAPNRPPYTMSVQQLVYVWLCSIFVTCLITADVIGVKLFEIKLPFKIFGISTVEHTCGMITFPVTFMLGDVINEYYGPRAAKRTVYIGLAMSIFVALAVELAQLLPFLDRPFNVRPDAFNSIFGSAKLMYVASLTAYLIGQLSDIWLFSVIKRLTGGKMLWLRATGSTLVSQLIDSFVVSYVAFGGGKTLTGQIGASLNEIWVIAITGYVLKFFAAALMTPFLYVVRGFMHRRFDLEPLPHDHEDE